MSYSFSDFTDNVFKELGKSGAIRPEELNDENTMENVQLQGDYAIKAIDRLVAVRDAAAEFHKLVRAAAVRGVSLDDEVFKAAETRLTAALHEAGSAS
jgi:hypothetical protein